MHPVAILVAEDEPFIALDLAQAVEDAGGQVVGPAASVEDAMALLAQTPVAGAILDVNLEGPDITLVAETLAGLGVPIIVQTGGSLPADLVARFPAIVVHSKPCLASALVAELNRLIAIKDTTVAA